ncbi:sterol desaturase family protein [Aquihabitans sp. McL0605]|uniref:sterol desaturase family protein n=1 Tax=Aquihabitans sp. McL0605 TaxID=3415671 RepID=UPI003CF6FF9E
MDLTVIAIPAYFSTMGAEYRYLKNQAQDRAPIAGDYTKDDTLASLAMGVGSLLAPLTLKRLVDPVTPGRGKYGKALVATALGAAAITTIADVLAKREEAGGRLPHGGTRPDLPTGTGTGTATGTTGPAGTTDDDALPDGNRRKRRSLARRIAGSAGATAVAGGVLAASTAWASKTTADRLWKSHKRDLGTGVAATVGAVVAWDFIYYWNHRLMHTSRWMWAIHVVHHSSEHYNLSTALRQPVLDVVGVFVPVGAMALMGFRPDTIETARGVNLLYQYWIHTETVPKLGPIEEVLNTASHHRVHHGSNRQYLDRNHGSIFIIWDRLFGTFEREAEPVTYGLTKNIDTYNPVKIATHEHIDILKDVASSTSWTERLSFAFRGPGWAYERHAQRGDLATVSSAHA